MDWVLLLIGSFLASVAGSYTLTRLGMRRRAVAPRIGTTLRLRARSGVYRSKLIRVDGDLWRISTPLQRNNYVPLRVSEPVTVEAPVPGGVYLFRTSISEQDTDRQELTFLAPALAKPTDRRSEPRWIRSDTISVDDFPGMLVDLSKHGARLKSSCRARLGDRVKVRLPEGMIVGWVIDAWPTRPGDAFSHILRVRFEAPIA